MEESDFSDVNEKEEVVVEELDPDNPDHAFAILERDFTKTVAELEQNPDLSQYADEFNKVFDAYYKSYEHERELTETGESLQKEIDLQTEKLAVGQKLASNDLETINQLKEQMQHTWRMIDNAHAREQAAQEIIDNLRKQIINLNAEIDFKNKMSAQDDQDEQLSKHKDNLQREKDKLISEVAKITEKLNNALTYQEELERRTSEADLVINEVNNKLEDTEADVERYKKVKEKLEEEIVDLKENIEGKQVEIVNLNEIIVAVQRHNGRLEVNIKEQKQATEKCARESETMNGRYAKLQDEFDVLNFNNELVKKEIAKRIHEVKFKEEECIKLRNDIAKVMKSKDMMDKKMVMTETERDELTMDRNKLRCDIVTREKEIDDLKRISDVTRRNLEHVEREKEILNKNYVRQQAVSRDHTKLIKIQEQAKRKLLMEIDSHTLEHNRKVKQISYLEKERDRLLEEELELTKKIEDGLDEIKLKKVTIYDLKKNVAENETRLRMQQNLFDGIRSERNALQKALQESSTESSELRVKLKVVSHQTEQLKEDIAMKEQLLIKEENVLRKVNKEKENLRVDLNNATDTIRSLKQDISEMTSEQKRLHKVITDGDRFIRQQTKDLEQLMNERDILGSQLVRRNDELALLYEKITILQTTLHRGEAQYEQRLEDIRLLKVEIKRLRQQKNLLTKSISNMTDLRQEIFHLERDLTCERLKSRALEEDLQNPMNIHRWRKLEGSDPEILELLKKIQILQKRLLNQASEAVERERQLKESERLYLNLRQVVAKQPGPETQLQLHNTQKTLSVHINKMKCLASELNMTELKALEYKTELDRVTEDLNNLKKRHTADKKALQKRSVLLQPGGDSALAHKDSNTSQTSSQKKYAGGGFRLSVTNVTK